MGYDRARFIGEIEEVFMCSLCAMVLQNPLQSPCNHMFCKGCIQDWLLQVRSCPENCKLLSPDELKVPVLFIRNVLNKLIIRCEFQQRGCNKMVMLGYLETHCARCEFNPTVRVENEQGNNSKIVAGSLSNPEPAHRVEEKGSQVKVKKYGPAASKRSVEVAEKVEGKSAQVKVKKNGPATSKISVEVAEKVEGKSAQVKDKKNGRAASKRSVEVAEKVEGISAQVKVKKNGRAASKRIVVFVEKRVKVTEKSDDVGEISPQVGETNAQVEEKITPVSSINSQQQQNESVDNSTMHQQNLSVDEPKCVPDSDTLNIVPLKWHMLDSFEATNDILEVKKKSIIAFAQAACAVKPSDPSFKVKILDFHTSKYIAIGLSCSGHRVDRVPGLLEPSISCDNTGDFIFNKISTKLGDTWCVGDVIECGINFPVNYTSGDHRQVKFYFRRNQQLIVQKRIPMPGKELLPTIWVFEGIVGSWWHEGEIRMLMDSNVLHPENSLMHDIIETVDELNEAVNMYITEAIGPLTMRWQNVDDILRISCNLNVGDM